MLREIYCRNINDPGFIQGVLETGSPYEAILTKIRMIISTSKGEVLGDPNFGLSLEQLLFELNFSAGQLQKAFYAQLATYVPDTQNMPVTLEVTFSEGTVRDIAIHNHLAK